MPAKKLKENSQSKKTILIIEDNLFMAELLASKIKQKGYDVAIALDGEEALEKISEKNSNLVVLDLQFSDGINGFEVLHRIREEKDIASLPVVVLSKLETQVDKNISLGLGASAYLVKAYTTIDEIVEKCSIILEKGVSFLEETSVVPVQEVVNKSKKSVQVAEKKETGHFQEVGILQREN